MLTFQKSLPLIEKDFTETEKLLYRSVRDAQQVIKQVGNYTFKSGGKRIRPILVILSARTCGYNGKDHIKLAAAMELIHTATLLHDDVIDSAKFRRGRPSVNSVWGNKVSILAGDFLFARASNIVNSIGNEEITRKLLGVVEGMVEGELVQLKMVKKPDYNFKTYFTIIRKKTSSLIAACCEGGAIVSGVKKRQREAMRRFGVRVGDAFQIVDDVIDISSDFSVSGKSPVKDFEEGKITLPLLYALRKGRKIFRGKIAEIMSKNEITDKDVNTLKEIAFSSGGVEYSLNVAKRRVEEAKSYLKIFEGSVYLDMLRELSDYIVERKS